MLSEGETKTYPRFLLLPNERGRRSKQSVSDTLTFLFVLGYMTIDLLYRLAKAKRQATGFVGKTKQLSLWLINYLTTGTSMPEVYHRFIGHIEREDNASILKEIGTIKRLVDQELATRN